MGDAAGQSLTPIERAKADIRRMQNELARVRAQVLSLEHRLQKAEAYVEMSAVYEADETQSEAGRARAPAGVVAVATQATKEILMEHGRSLHTRQILRLLEERDVQIGGRDPVANLSGFLSRDADFSNSRATGWALSEWGSDVAPKPDPAPSVSSEAISKSAPSWDRGSDLDDEIPF